MTAGARRGVRWEGIRGLFHRDPKRIVGVLRVTLLNRLNNSTEWAELPFGRQTLHHDWLLPYRGLQASLFVLSLGIELTHFLHPKLPTVIRIGEQDSGRAVPSPPDDRVCLANDGSGSFARAAQRRGRTLRCYKTESRRMQSPVFAVHSSEFY